jgi:EAL and modified HD-GYP domain-containing signal transduction protein
MRVALSVSAVSNLIDSDPVVEEVPKQEIFLARQPILDGQKRLKGYELLFRGGHVNSADISNDMHATSTVLANAFGGFGMQSVLGAVDGYLNVDHSFVMSDLVDLLAPEQIVLELVESVSASPELLERLRALRAKGFRVALGDYAGQLERFTQFASCIDILKVNMVLHPRAGLAQTVRAVNATKVTLLAEKVETQDDFRDAQQLGFKLFQGYHFARPEMLVSKVSGQPEKVQILKLLNLILTDASILAIESELKRHPVLSINLMRLVNSVAMGNRVKITSVRHAVTILGQRQLRNWLQLMIYTSRGGEDCGTNPLLQMAASRAKLMELMMRRYEGASEAMIESAFMTGMLSLVDVLLNMPLETIVAELALAEDVKVALIDGAGRLGTLLKITQLVDGQNEGALRPLLADVPVDGLEGLFLLEMEAFAWANAISMA